MSKIEEHVGKKYYHPQLGNVKVEQREGNSRTKVEVTVLDRGEGWDKKLETYKGVKTSNGWYRGENREFNTKHITHINDLIN